MRTILISILGFFLVVPCYSSPIHLASKTADNSIKSLDFAKNGSSKDEAAKITTKELSNDLQPAIIFNNPNTTAKVSKGTDVANNETLEYKDAIVIDLEKVTKMSAFEYVGRQIRSLWEYLLLGNKEEKEGSFVGRCMRIAKKLGQLIPIAMTGGAVIILKLAFLILFSLKSLGLLGLLLLLNVGSIAAKLGALWASKKSGQNLHFHVDKSDDHYDHGYSSHHLHGPPYGWDDRDDKGFEGHELYNLYEKLKIENDVRKLLSSVRRDNHYHRI